MARRIALIGAPTSAGAYAPGQERAPAAFRAHGIVDAIRRAGWELRDTGDVERFRWRPDPSRPTAMNLDAVVRIAAEVSARVAAALGGGERALVLGGDCTVELGTVAGALEDGRTTGLVYVDLDTDLNPPAASDGALDWTVVAHLLEVEGAARELSSVGPRRPMLADQEILYVAARPETPTERATLLARSLPVIGLAEVHPDPALAGRRAAAWGARFDRLLVHVDVDVLSYTAFPIAENVRREDGLSLAELGAILGPLVAAPNWAALTVAEVNPDHAPVEAATFGAFIGMLEQALGAGKVATGRYV
ncbi:MAG TPA: arginase family protein [Gemmatimonadaceae bacterium]|nr:arginase family protein [Gemmatimonadaceae bacterium]